MAGPWLCTAYPQPETGSCESNNFSLLYGQEFLRYAPFTMKIQDAYPLFLAYGKAERQYARETLGKLKDCFNSWILPCLGDKELGDLSRADMISFRSELVDAKLGTNRQ